MPSDPLVCAVMLSRDRPAMAKRAVECFREQTYGSKTLAILNTGTDTLETSLADDNVMQLHLPTFFAGRTIGALRNEANARTGAEILIHWDDDDVSHPNRIAEQVALLQASGKECVGYRECLFWKQGVVPGVNPILYDSPGEAWLYHNADPRRALGASLCYWRSAWEKRPFPDLPKTRNGTAEDTEWLKGVDSVGVSGFDERPSPAGANPAYAGEPRLVCSIHAGNSTDYDPAGLVRNGSPNWKRVPEWDDFCRGRMAL